MDTELDNKWTNWRSQPKNSFIYQIMSGRAGENVGLFNGLERVSKYTSGTQEGRYYLIGADSGAGKTTIADYMFVINAWLDAKAKGKKIKIYYCSFEISELDKNAKWCAWYIFWKYGKSIPINYILGRLEGNYMTDEETALVKEAWEFVQEMKKDIKIVEESVNPTAIFEGLVQHYEKYGTVERRQSEEDKKKGRKGKVIGYTVTEKVTTILFVDHLKLTHPEMGLDMKKTMDKLSRYCVILKNLFGTTCVVLQQFNTDMLSSRREMITKNKDTASFALTPNRKDLGDSTSSFQDADFVLGLMMPKTYALDKFRGYDCSDDGFRAFFIALYIMKNKNGESEIMCPLFMNPVANCVYDLPDVTNPFEVDELEKWMQKARDLRKELERFVPIRKEK